MVSHKIAIVGMAGRFPGARNVREFWQNLRNGVESIITLSDAELLAGGVAPEEMARPDYVKRAAVLDDVPLFDAAFFGLSPRDAAIMDPQHRHFLECVQEALEDAAHLPREFSGSIGMFAGSGFNGYLVHNLLANTKLVEEEGLFRLKQTGNDKDVLATRASYHFDLRGPSINVQTACSTSLVAVHLACQSLLNHECDMALAGGVTIEIPHGQGYVYREGEILSRDGHCRPFDAASTGTVFGSGVGVVVLRRLEDALAEGDAVRAVISGSAINNDGARKAGYFAPSVDGQADVIAEALEFAGVTAEDISYVEAHGTGTLVGDPIEMRALTQAFRKYTQRVGYCGIGSLKSNVGHLDAAAGVASLIKTALALEHEELPPSLHFNTPNPHLELEGSPFFVNAVLRPWPASAEPRRAGVTSLGIGGTNAHVIVEQAPHTNKPQPERRSSQAASPFKRHSFWIQPERLIAAGVRASQALPGALLPERPTEFAYESMVSPAQHWVLAEHMLKTEDGAKCLLPGTAYLEMARAAFMSLQPDGARSGGIELRDVFFTTPLLADPDESRVLRINLKRDADCFRFTVASRQGEWLEHCTGTVGPCAPGPHVPVDYQALLARCGGSEAHFNAQQRTQQERYLAFGPRWHSLRCVVMGRDEAVAELQLSDALLGDLAAWGMHPALLDLATGASFYLTKDYASSDELFLPIGYKQLRVYGSLPARFFSHIHARTTNLKRNEVESFDLTLFDQQGTVLIEIEGFSARRVAPGHVSSSGKLEADRADVAKSEPSTHARQMLPQPQAENSIEETLTRWWCELLGVTRVQEDDDFFELGGHSLIAVRLLARVKKTYGADLDLITIFEERTVRQLAAAIRARQPKTSEPVQS